jgi:hypothetical protein
MPFLDYVMVNIWIWFGLVLLSFGINLVLTGGALFKYFKAILAGDLNGVFNEFENIFYKLPLLIIFGLVGTIAGLLLAVAIIIRILIYVKFYTP